MLAGRQATRTPRDLSNARLVAILVGATGAAIAGLVLRGGLPATWARPGDPLLHSAAILGSISLVASLLAVFGKRVGWPGKAGFHRHVWLASVGTALVVMHSTGTLLRIPSLLLLLLLALLALGLWSRLAGARQMTRVFGSKLAAFSAADEGRRSQLAELIEMKTVLLAQLEPAADEGTFSLAPHHWYRRPRAAFAYHQAVVAEHRLIGTRQSVPPSQAYWRLLHRLLAWCFLVGLAAHVVTVTFFAGYVADGGEIYWPRLADWGS